VKKWATFSALSTIAMSTTGTIASKYFPILTRTGVFLNHPCHQFEQVMLIKLDHFKNFRSKKSKKPLKPQIHQKFVEIMKRTQQSAKVKNKCHVGIEVPKLPAMVPEHQKLEEAEEP